MAGRIKGITVEIGGDTTGLEKALKSVNTTIKQTQTALKDVTKLLKLAPPTPSFSRRSTNSCSSPSARQRKNWSLSNRRRPRQRSSWRTALSARTNTTLCRGRSSRQSRSSAACRKRR